MSDETKFEKAHREYLELKAEARYRQSKVATHETTGATADAKMDDAIADFERERDEAIAGATQVCTDNVTEVRGQRAAQVKFLESAREALDCARKKIAKRGEGLQQLLNDEMRNQ